MDWTLDVMRDFGYWGVLVVVLLENLFPPIPSEVVLPFAGFLVGRGTLALPGVLIAASAGSVAGAFLLYGLGRLLGRERVRAIVRRHGRLLTVSEASLDRAEAWFDRYGTWTVFFCRMVPLLRSLVSIPAGLAGMNLALFGLYTAAGTLLWNTLLVGLGAALGAAWPQVTRWVSYYQDVVVAAVLLAAALLLWRARVAARRRP